MAWITVDKTSGNADGIEKTYTVKVHVDKNESDVEKKANIEVVGCEGMLTQIVKVSQGAGNVYKIPEFDYLVVRYKWCGENGTDFDSATAIKDSNISSVDNKYIGWSGPGKFVYCSGAVGTCEQNSTDYYLMWGGDQQNSETACGVETILINMKKFREQASVPKCIHIDMKGNWYGTKKNGNVTISVTAYKGGTMEYVSGQFDYKNVGGEEVYLKDLTVNVPSVGDSNYEGNFSKYTNMAFLTYYTDSHEGTLTQGAYAGQTC